MHSRFRSYLEINVALLILGQAPLFARLIEADAMSIVFFRCVTGGLTLAVFLKISGVGLRVRTRRDALHLALMGALLGAHWTLYFLAVQISSVAIAMLALYTFPVFTALLEPLFFRTRIRFVEFLVLAWVLAGVFFISLEFNPGGASMQGVLIGLASSLLFALRNLYSKKFLEQYDSSVIMLHQLGWAALVVLPFTIDLSAFAHSTNAAYGLLLGIGVTAIAHTLWVRGLTHIKATTVSLLSCIGPVYGIAAAALILDEFPDARTLLGGGIILSGVLFEILRQMRVKPEQTGQQPER